jgi:hypothetical protein
MIALLLVSCVLFFLAIELGVRRAAVRVSRIESRTEQEYRDVLAMRREADRKGLLVLCNSLLGIGLDFDRLKLAIAPEWDARRLYMDDTTFYDWYYGARRLLARGVEVDAVALALSARQLAGEPHVRGDYFAYRLMAPGDVVRVAADVGVPRTEASNMLLASGSAFYGLRGEIRKVLLGRLLPDLPLLMERIVRFDQTPLDEDQTYRRAFARLTAFRELLDSHQTRFLVILPPIPKTEGLAAVERAAADAHVTLVTVPRDLTGASDYSDNFHLNATGARKYTSALTVVLSRTLGSPVRVAKAD